MAFSIFVAASTGDAFATGIVIGLLAGVFLAPLARGWVLWRERSRSSTDADDITIVGAARPRPEALTPPHAEPRGGWGGPPSTPA
jgi:hypothetical protein